MAKIKNMNIGWEIKKIAALYPVRLTAVTILLASVLLTITGVIIAGAISQNAGNIVILAGGAAWFGGWTAILVAKLGTYAGKQW